MIGMSKRLSAAVAGAALLAWAATASADGWNERTTLTFSEPVIVPGATLQPGTYEFELLDSSTNRNIVQISREDGTIVTTTQAVPTKRADRTGDVVLRFNPTDAGTPPALKAWFYPGTSYGHEFIYPDTQAREIAQRTKSIVLSTDVPGSDMEKGTLRTYDQSGQRAEWRADESVMREWGRFYEQWRTGADRRAGDAAARESTAPMVEGRFQAMRVSLSDVEENPSKYTGKTISTDGEVEEVFGPRFFSIDERRWGDLDGEILVLLPAGTAAMVREDDRVTVTGTLRPFVRAEFEREWGWLGLDPGIEVELGRKPVLVADRLVGGNNDVALIIKGTGAQPPAEDRAVGTSGTAADGRRLQDLAAVASGGERLVGRQVKLEGVRVTGTADKGGFFVNDAGNRVFVLPSGHAGVSDGKTVSIEGVVLQMPDDMDERLAPGGDLNDEIYIYATSVS